MYTSKKNLRLTLVSSAAPVNFTPIMKKTVVHIHSSSIASSATGTTTFTTTIR
ncbi:MAG: hypothetical protein KA160_04915 [Lacibacter sp.]|nr:hypothetical protein [Lacibacter sp.]